MNSYKKFSRDMGIAGLANIISMLKGLILLPILTKTLGTGNYGLWILIQAGISLMMPIAILQLGFAMTRFVAVEKDKNSLNRGFSTILIAASLSAIIVSISFFVLATSFSLIPVINNSVLQLAAFIVFLAALDQIIIEYFTGFRQMERYAIFIIAQSVGEIALISYAILNNYGILGAMISLTLTKIFLFVIPLLRISSEVRICKPDYTMLKTYLMFSLPLLPFTLSQWIIDLSNRYVIEHFMNLNAVGIYSAACGIGTLVSFFYAPISIVLLPTITSLHENGNAEELKTHLKYSLNFFLMFAIPSLFGLSILSKVLLTSLSTPEFATGYLIIPVITFGTIIQRSSWIFSNILMLFKKSKMIATIYIFSALSNIILNAILVPSIGIMGAAIATLISIMIIFLITKYISRKMLLFDIDLKFLIKSILSALIMSVVLLNLNISGYINILIAVCVSSLIYIFALISLKGFTRDEYRFIMNALGLDSFKIKEKI